MLSNILNIFYMLILAIFPAVYLARRGEYTPHNGPRCVAQFLHSNTKAKYLILFIEGPACLALTRQQPQ